MTNSSIIAQAIAEMSEIEIAQAEMSREEKNIADFRLANFKAGVYGEICIDEMNWFEYRAYEKGYEI